MPRHPKGLKALKRHFHQVKRRGHFRKQLEQEPVVIIEGYDQLCVGDNENITPTEGCELPTQSELQSCSLGDIVDADQGGHSNVADHDYAAPMTKTLLPFQNEAVLDFTSGDVDELIKGSCSGITTFIKSPPLNASLSGLTWSVVPKSKEVGIQSFTEKTEVENCRSDHSYAVSICMKGGTLSGTQSARCDLKFPTEPTRTDDVCEEGVEEVDTKRSSINRIDPKDVIMTHFPTLTDSEEGSSTTKRSLLPIFQGNEVNIVNINEGIDCFSDTVGDVSDNTTSVRGNESSCSDDVGSGSDAGINVGDSLAESDIDPPDSPMVALALPAETVQLLSQVESDLKLLLPSHADQLWNPVVTNRGILVGLLSPSRVYAVQRSVCVSPEGEVTLAVHGKRLPDDHSVYQHVRRVPLREDFVHEFSQNVASIVASFRLYEICNGVQTYKELWKSCGKGVIDKNLFKEKRYVETFRSTLCLGIVPNVKTKKCSECNKLSNALHKRQIALTRRGEGTPRTPKATRPRRSMTSGELKKKLDHDKKIRRNLTRQNLRLKEKVRRLLKTEGEVIDEETSDGTRAALKSSDLSKFVEVEQIKASSLKDRQGTMWHPAVIRVAFSSLRNSKWSAPVARCSGSQVCTPP